MALTQLTTIGGSSSPSTLKDGAGTTRVEANTSGAVVSGILTATSFDGVSESDTPLAVNGKFYEIDDVLLVDATIQISRASSNPGKIYTQFQEVVVGTAPGTVELIIADGEEFIIDAYQLGVV